MVQEGGGELTWTGASDGRDSVVGGVEGEVTADLLKDATFVESVQHPVWGSTKGE